MGPEPLERFADATVLVVDDNENNLMLLQAVLSRAGINRVVTEIDSRRVVGRLLDEVEPDLIILDLHMPHVDGYAVLEHIAEFSGGAYIPVLVLTADNTAGATRRALEAGAHDFVTKPFDRSEVLLRARNLLENRFLRMTLRRHNLTSDTGELANASEIAKAGELAGTGIPDATDTFGGEHSETAAGMLPRDSLSHDVLIARRDRIRSALEPGNLIIHLQPIVDISVPAVVGHEALARFPHDPGRSTERWFAEAFEVGLGIELELTALAAALKLCEQLDASTFMAVNISVRTALSGQLDDCIPAALRPRLVLELTEHTPVENYDAVLRSLTELRAQGVLLAVDDAGAGYAGFRHLLSLQPDVIKLDMALTRGINTSPAHRALASALVRFAHDVDARLIAEGVETVDEIDTLAELGVTWMQGFAFARPSASPVFAPELPAHTA